MSLQQLTSQVVKPYLNIECNNAIIDGTLTANNITIDTATVDNLTVTTNLTVGGELLVEGFSSLNTLQVASLATLNGPVVINNQNKIQNQWLGTFGCAAASVSAGVLFSYLDGQAISLPTSTATTLANSFVTPGTVTISKATYFTISNTTSTVFNIVGTGAPAVVLGSFTCPTALKGVVTFTPIIVVAGTAIGVTWSGTGTNPGSSVVELYVS